MTPSSAGLKEEKKKKEREEGRLCVVGAPLSIVFVMRSRWSAPRRREKERGERKKEGKRKKICRERADPVDRPRVLLCCLSRPQPEGRKGGRKKKKKKEKGKGQTTRPPAPGLIFHLHRFFAGKMPGERGGEKRGERERIYVLVRRHRRHPSPSS